MAVCCHTEPTVDNSILVLVDPDLSSYSSSPHRRLFLTARTLNIPIVISCAVGSDTARQLHDGTNSNTSVSVVVRNVERHGFLSTLSKAFPEQRKHVILAGVHLEHWILVMARYFRQNAYAVFVPLDACLSSDVSEKQQAIEQLQVFKCATTTTSALLFQIIVSALHDDRIIPILAKEAIKLAGIKPSLIFGTAKESEDESPMAAMKRPAAAAEVESEVNLSTANSTTSVTTESPISVRELKVSARTSGDTHIMVSWVMPNLTSVDGIIVSTTITCGGSLMKKFVSPATHTYKVFDILAPNQQHLIVVEIMDQANRALFRGSCSIVSPQVQVEPPNGVRNENGPRKSTDRQDELISIDAKVRDEGATFLLYWSNKNLFERGLDHLIIFTSSTGLSQPITTKMKAGAASLKVSIDDVDADYLFCVDARDSQCRVIGRGRAGPIRARSTVLPPLSSSVPSSTQIGFAAVSENSHIRLHWNLSALTHFGDRGPYELTTSCGKVQEIRELDAGFYYIKLQPIIYDEMHNFVLKIRNDRLTVLITERATCRAPPVSTTLLAKQIKLLRQSSIIETHFGARMVYFRYLFANVAASRISETGELLPAIPETRRLSDGSPLTDITGIVLTAAQSNVLPTMSCYGDRRVDVNARTLLESFHKLYLAELSCSNGGAHRAFLVVVRQGTGRDRFCAQRFVPLDFFENPLLQFTYNQDQLQMSMNADLVVQLLFWDPKKPIMAYESGNSVTLIQHKPGLVAPPWTGCAQCR